MKKANISIVSICISLVITLVFTVASLYIPIVTGIFGAVLISFMTFLLSYACIELPKYISNLKTYNELIKYQVFINHGISDFYSDFTHIQFAQDIVSARNIKLLLMYSRNFIVNNLSAIREFLQKDGATLDVALIMNETEHPVYKYLTKKYDYTPNKVNESLDTFLRLMEADIAPYIHENSKICIYFIDFLPAYSLYMFDNHAYITLYKTAPKRMNTVPSFKIGKARQSDFFNFLLDDMNELLSHGETKKIVLSRNGRQVEPQNE